MIDYIYQNGLHYDRLFAEANEELSFWLAQARKYNGPILELATGTGRIAIPLAKEGFQVTGIDNSAAMLEEARRKAANEGVQAEWVQADMRDFELDKSFSLVILPANALCHLLDLKDFEQCLAKVRSHLGDNGKFIIDVFVPMLELLIDKPEERFPFSEYDDPNGNGRIVVTHSYTYEAATQIKRIKTFHSVPGQAQEIEGELNMRMYFPQELDALLKYNGFRIEEKYGNYAQEAFDGKAQKQLIVCSLM